MRTVEFLPQDKQLRKATEARDVFVPAARLLTPGYGRVRAGSTRLRHAQP